MIVSKAITRALRLIQVIDPIQSVSDADMETAIDALNGLLRRWEASGLALGFQPVSSPSDTLPVPDEALDAVTYAVAVRVASEYGVTPMPEVVATANNLYADLLRDQAVATPIRPIIGGPMPAQYNGATINGSTWYNG